MKLWTSIVDLCVTHGMKTKQNNDSHTRSVARTNDSTLLRVKGSQNKTKKECNILGRACIVSRLRCMRSQGLAAIVNLLLQTQGGTTINALSARDATECNVQRCLSWVHCGCYHRTTAHSYMGRLWRSIRSTGRNRSSRR